MRCLATLLALLLLGCAAPDPAATEVESDAQAQRPASADHHMHIQSARAAQVMHEAMLAVGEAEEGSEPGPSHTAADAIAALDHAGIEGGLVLSNAYMYGMPEVDAGDEELALVQAENDWVAAQVAEYPERLVGLCSINPLADYAQGEIRRCAADPLLGALKLHLANSDADLLDAEHLEAIRAVFALADASSLPVLIHMRTRNPEYGAADANAFIDGVLPSAPSIHIQIAHMAGWGGYDDNTHQALGAFVEAIQDGRADAERLSFGLGAVVFEPDVARTEERKEEVRQSNQRLAERIREIGTGRVVYATDWPAWPPVDDPETKIERNVELIRSALPLEDAEIEQILGNVNALFGG